MLHPADRPRRVDPYRQFRYRLNFDGRPVAGISSVAIVPPLLLPQGNRAADARKAPGRSSFDAVTLERGVTHDAAFEQWARSFVPHRGDPLASIEALRRDLVLERVNEAGATVELFRLHRCWVSEFAAVPDLDANANAVAIAKLKLETEGWQRDTVVTEPREPG